jgi:hypothetical protein
VRRTAAEVPAEEMAAAARVMQLLARNLAAE